MRQVSVESARHHLMNIRGSGGAKVNEQRTVSDREEPICTLSGPRTDRIRCRQTGTRYDAVEVAATEDRTPTVRAGTLCTWWNQAPFDVAHGS